QPMDIIAEEVPPQPVERGPDDAQSPAGWRDDGSSQHRWLRRAAWSRQERECPNSLWPQRSAPPSSRRPSENASARMWQDETFERCFLPLLSYVKAVPAVLYWKARMMRSSPKTMAYIFYLLIKGPLKGPLLPLPLPCLLSLSCLDGHLLRLTLATCDADPLRAAPSTNGEHNREDPILELRLDIVGIDRPGEGDHPFKCAGDDFPREPVVSTPMAFH